MAFLNILLAAVASAETHASTVDPTPATRGVQEAEEAAEPDATEEPPGWTGAFTLGASLSGGNTDIKKASATFDAVKELEKNRYTIGLSWNFSEEDDEITQRRTYGKFQYDRLVTERLYWLANTSGEADKSADLDLRFIVGAGVGYQFKDTETFKLSGEAGLSYFDADYENDADDTDYVAARLAYKWDWIQSERWSLGQSGEIYPSLEDADDVYAKLDTRAKATLTENMFAQLQWLYDWNNTPAEGKERVDNLYLLTVGWKF